TDRIWVYNNVSYDHTNGNGIFIWDPDNGPTNVLFAHNTLINNKNSFYFEGAAITAELMNNLGYSTGTSVANSSTKSTINNHDNLWLTGVTGFVAPSSKDFRLTSSSTAINKAKTPPTFSDDLGNTYRITTDFANLNRTSGSAPDMGAYEYQ
ncbi:hypothetical protein J7643_18145, partial [bacterium]|nr:hypothetical protein [bacterium]